MVRSLSWRAGRLAVMSFTLYIFPAPGCLMATRMLKPRLAGFAPTCDTLLQIHIESCRRCCTGTDKQAGNRKMDGWVGQAQTQTQQFAWRSHEPSLIDNQTEHDSMKMASQATHNSLTTHIAREEPRKYNNNKWVGGRKK